MDLMERAYLLDQPTARHFVIEDKALLDWAAARGIPPKDAQLTALEKEIIPLRYVKNFTALSIGEQIAICRSKVLVCGCGGLGGIVIQLLARAGVGQIRVADGDTFAPSNLNRQILSDVERLNRSKAVVAGEAVRRINPLIEAEAFDATLDASNAEEMIHGMDAVLDALDNLPGRFLLAETCSRKRVPFVHAAVAGWWGQISTFLPGSSGTLDAVYGTKRSRDPQEDALGVLGPTAAAIGSLEAMEALRILSGREAAYSGKLLYFDGETGQMSLVSLGSDG